ncbi:MAG: hypothetical protein ABJA78_15015 [Ferruginibacter sp.]
MSINLLKNVQQNLKYPPLKKVDPNIQDVALDPTVPDTNRFGQAAIPSILIALYRFLKTDEGAKVILGENNSTNWVDILFADRKAEAISNIASYSFYTHTNSEADMNAIASEAIRLIKEHVTGTDPVKAIEKTMSAERDGILPYLPAVLNMGNILGDETLDDKTNKMEGPISSLMHKIETGFSNP